MRRTAAAAAPPSSSAASGGRSVTSNSSGGAALSSASSSTAGAPSYYAAGGPAAAAAAAAASAASAVSAPAAPKAFEELYELGSELGRGSFGVVRECTRRGARGKFAVKILPKQKKNEALSQRWRQEAQLLQSLDHPNVVRLYEIVETRENIYMVMELMRGGELSTVMRQRGSFPESDAREVAAKLISAVAYLHSKDIIHRDLKPENILVSTEGARYNIKIADFGLSQVVDSLNMVRSRAGTPLYMAPEVVRGKAYSEQADMWSVGVILYHLMCGRVPFSSTDEESLAAEIVHGKIEFGDGWEDVSDSARDLIRRLLRVAPTERYDAKEALRHPWITGDADGGQRDTVMEMMRAFNAERKMRKTVLVAIALRRLCLPILGGQHLRSSRLRVELSERAEHGSSGGAGSSVSTPLRLTGLLRRTSSGAGCNTSDADFDALPPAHADDGSHMSRHNSGSHDELHVVHSGAQLSASAGISPLNSPTQSPKMGSMSSAAVPLGRELPSMSSVRAQTAMSRPRSGAAEAGASSKPGSATSQLANPLASNGSGSSLFQLTSSAVVSSREPMSRSGTPVNTSAAGGGGAPTASSSYVLPPPSRSRTGTQASSSTPAVTVSHGSRSPSSTMSAGEEMLPGRAFLASAPVGIGASSSLSVAGSVGSSSSNASPVLGPGGVPPSTAAGSRKSAGAPTAPSALPRYLQPTMAQPAAALLRQRTASTSSTSSANSATGAAARRPTGSRS